MSPPQWRLQNVEVKNLMFSATSLAKFSSLHLHTFGAGELITFLSSLFWIDSSKF